MAKCGVCMKCGWQFNLRADGDYVDGPCPVCEPDREVVDREVVDREVVKSEEEIGTSLVDTWPPSVDEAVRLVNVMWRDLKEIRAGLGLDEDSSPVEVLSAIKALRVMADVQGSTAVERAGARPVLARLRPRR